MWPWLLGSSGGLIAMALVFALARWQKRRYYARSVEDRVCPLCRTPFAEALYEVETVLSASDYARLDGFQRRFVAFTVHCHECGGTLYCTETGEPMKAVPEQG